MPPSTFHTRSADQRRLEQTFQRYSLAKVLRQLMNGDRLDGFEAEVEQQFGGASGTQNRMGQTITIPWGVLASQRDMNVAAPGAGGYLVGNAMGPAADVLRPYSVATRAGITTLSGLRSDVPIPSVFEEVEFAWLVDETSLGPSVTPTTGLATMRPHLACGLINYSGRLVRGMPPGVLEFFVRRRLLQAAGRLVDRVTLDGRSNRGSALGDDMAEPLGLCNIAGVQRFSATNPSGKLVSAGINPAMSYVATKADSDEACSFILSPFMRESLLPNYVGGSGPIDGNGKLQGKAVHCTAGMRANAGAYGEWSNAVLGLWGEGIEIAIDPFTGFRGDNIAMRCAVSMDVAFPNPAAFAVVEITAV